MSLPQMRNSGQQSKAEIDLDRERSRYQNLKWQLSQRQKKVIFLQQYVIKLQQFVRHQQQEKIHRSLIVPECDRMVEEQETPPRRAPARSGQKVHTEVCEATPSLRKEKRLVSNPEERVRLPVLSRSQTKNLDYPRK